MSDGANAAVGPLNQTSGHDRGRCLLRHRPSKHLQGLLMHFDKQDANHTFVDKQGERNDRVTVLWCNVMVTHTRDWHRCHLW